MSVAVHSFSIAVVTGRQGSNAADSSGRDRCPASEDQARHGRLPEEVLLAEARPGPPDAIRWLPLGAHLALRPILPMPPSCS